ncbi:hypothetical protein [Nitrospirillum pindoramense]|uniref:Uncharacterized protein n=1 Tax=Nitrospirillum amazonense TaxID=28077 RepID=A0A560HFS7_9PROT|nr:hypothetical protein [Nitrospirillum amazonense]TWB45283.1 hypothetical protein FBZ90_102240 [Nitrospirillum amazonense]
MRVSAAYGMVVCCFLILMPWSSRAASGTAANSRAFLKDIVDICRHDLADYPSVLASIGVSPVRIAAFDADLGRGAPVADFDFGGTKYPAVVKVRYWAAPPNARLGSHDFHRADADLTLTINNRAMCLKVRDIGSVLPMALEGHGLSLSPHATRRLRTEYKCDYTLDKQTALLVQSWEVTPEGCVGAIRLVQWS